MEEPRACYLFDLDGTLCNIEHRLHHIQGEAKDWDAFFDACDKDGPIEHMVQTCWALSTMIPIVSVSGRSDRVRGKTDRWLIENSIPSFGRLYMRKHGDHRDDDVVKMELLAQIIADGWKPIMAFDDRVRVVKAWRAAGVPCAHVVEGDY